MADKYREAIEQFITERQSPQGVNAISRALDVPVTTLQKYLERQDYFVKTERRQWDIPSNYTQSELARARNHFDNVIDSQLTGIESLIEMLMSQLRTTSTLLKAQKPVALAPVADHVPDIDQRYIELNNKVNNFRETVMQNINKVPREYKELVSNTDWHGMIMAKGKDWVMSDATGELAEVLLGQSNTLSEELVAVLKEYQL